MESGPWSRPEAGAAVVSVNVPPVGKPPMLID